jgi:hypothetical protein
MSRPNPEFVCPKSNIAHRACPHVVGGLRPYLIGIRRQNLTKVPMEFSAHRVFTKVSSITDDSLFIEPELL